MSVIIMRAINTDAEELLSVQKVAYKTLRLDEDSHLPIRLAINPGNNEEKRAAEKYLAGLKIISTIRY
ncbi:hypothetical protein [Paenibacillus agricola]|uniref:Uncharacterized protein n=1 Tax=Paenibacillus agricola TaxID=2716264 RepID=A0ABX0JK28_9BACL|nr:hypothetical protein [Paenibacillus agricola]NHN35472.1 hypothetical protein [Paenibacillus agricola]